MDVRLRKPLVFALLCIGTLPFIQAAPAVARVVGGIVLLFYIPGLAGLSFLGDRRRPFLDSVYLPLVISPVVIVVLAFIFFIATGSMRGSLRAACVLPTLLIFASLFLRRKEDSKVTAPVSRAILFVSFSFSGIIVVAYLMNSFLLYRSDAWYHISIVNEIVNRGIPPREPWLADEPIRYMWAFHFFIAGFKELSGLNAPSAMGIFNTINAFVFPYLVARLTALFRKERRFVLGTPLFTIATLGSASWILWPVGLIRAFFGGVRGSGEIARIVHGISIDGNSVIGFLTPYGLWAVNLIDKFFVITTFNFVLNLFLLCFVTIGAIDRRVRFDSGAIVIVFLALLGGLLFHVVLGVTLVAVVAGAGILLLLLRCFGPKKDDSFSTFHTIAVPGAAVAATVIVSPYILSLMGGGGGGGQTGQYFHFGIRNILTITAPLVILLPFSRAAFKELRVSTSGVNRVLVLWLVVLLGLNVVFNLPTPNASKFVYPLFLFLTSIVAWQIIEALGRSRGARLAVLWIVVVVLFVMPSVLTVRGFFLERPINEVEKRRMSVQPDERNIFEWIATSTPLSAVVIEGNVYNWMPVYGQRRDFFPDEDTIVTLGYGHDGRIGRFREIRDHIFSDGSLRANDMTDLEDMKMDLYVVVWREDMERFPGIEARLTAAPGWFARVYGNSAGIVFRLLPKGAGQEREGDNHVGS